MGFLIVAAIIIILFVYIIAMSHDKKQTSTSKPTQSYSSPTNRIDLKETVNLSFPAPNPDIEAEYLLFDVQTTGFPIKRYAPTDDVDNWPYVLSFAYALVDSDGNVKESGYFLLKRDIEVPADATAVNGITRQMLLEKGKDLIESLNTFAKAVEQCTTIVAHNLEFDYPIMEAELVRNGFGKLLTPKRKFCTYKAAQIIKRKDRKWFDGCSLEETLGNIVYDHMGVTIPDKRNASIALIALYHIFKEMYYGNLLALLRSFDNSPFAEDGYINKKAGEGYEYVEVEPGFVSKISRDAKNWTDNDRLNEICKLERENPREAISAYLEELSKGNISLFLLHRLVILYRDTEQYGEEKKFIKKAISYVDEHRMGENYMSYYKKRLLSVDTVYIPKKRIENAINNGKDLEKDGKFEDALKIYLSLVDGGDLNYSIISRVCVCYRKLKRTDDEIAFIDNVILTSDLTASQKNNLEKRLEALRK